MPGWKFIKGVKFNICLLSTREYHITFVLSIRLLTWSDTHILKIQWSEGYNDKFIKTAKFLKFG